MIIKKSSGLRFDSVNLNGWHFYGADLCLSSLNKGKNNYGILAPLVHDSSNSLSSGKKEFIRLLNVLRDKWGKRFSKIRTATSIITNGAARTYIEFKD